MINDTLNLRKQYGKFSVVESTEVESFNHVDFCQACGSHRPEKLIAVSAKEINLMVGSTCATILTSGKNPKIDEALKGTGEIYLDGEKEIVYATNEWFNQVELKNVISRYPVSNQVKYTRNDFVYNICKQLQDTGKITVKQYNKVNEIIATM